MDEVRNTSIVSASGRRYTVDERQLHVTSVFTKKGEHAVIDHATNADEEVLVALGYKQEFKRFALSLFVHNFKHVTHTHLVTSPGSNRSPYRSQFLVSFPQSPRL